MAGGVLGVIPARGGSRGLPGKNVIDLCGRPLIAHTIAAALESDELERLIVTTDSEEIRDLATAAGAEAPFLRPAELALDTTPGVDPIVHAVGWARENWGIEPEWTMCLQPTSPLRTAEDIREIVRLVKERNAPAAVGVVAVHDHPYWTSTMDGDGRLRPFLEDAPVVSRRQDLPPAYVLNGAIYLVRTGILIERRTLVPEGTLGYVMPRERSVDIDTTADLMLAKALMEDSR